MSITSSFLLNTELAQRQACSMYSNWAPSSLQPEPERRSAVMLVDLHWPSPEGIA
jgi:hypothetical protein